jgi:dUTPase
MFKVLDGATAPTRATKYSAMVDLYAREDVVIGAGETKIVPLGVKISEDGLQKLLVNSGREFMDYYFKKSHYLELHPRSSLRAKGLIIGVGVIDLDYPDEIGLIVHNPIANDIKHNSNGDYTINKGDKVAQCTLMEHKGYLLGIESDTERRGGFGSTGGIR